ncbi:hypothetical protein D3C87_1543260 [compost metagenome]
MHRDDAVAQVHVLAAGAAHAGHAPGLLVDLEGCTWHQCKPWVSGHLAMGGHGDHHAHPVGHLDAGGIEPAAGDAVAFVERCHRHIAPDPATEHGNDRIGALQEDFVLRLGRKHAYQPRMHAGKAQDPAGGRVGARDLACNGPQHAKVHAVAAGRARLHDAEEAGRAQQRHGGVGNAAGVVVRTTHRTQRGHHLARAGDERFGGGDVFVQAHGVLCSGVG